MTTIPTRRCKNWIQSYLHFTRHHLAEEQFHTFTALGVLSIATNRDRWMDAGYYKTFPNLFILFIGPSGVGKSSSSGIGIQLLRDAKLPHINIFTDFITSAGLVEFMSLCTCSMEIDGKLIHKTPVMIYASEIGTLINTRSNIRELTLIMTELFNKTGDFENRTRGGGKTVIKSPNLTFFACCFPEWINEELDSIALRSGFLGRILTVVSNKKRFKGMAPLTQSDTRLQGDLIHDLQIISSTVNRDAGKMIWSPNAEKAWEDWTDTLPLDLTSDESIEVQGFMSRKAQYVQRIAMLSSVSRDNSFIVTLEDFNFGMKLVEMCERNARNLKVRPEHLIQTDRVREVILRLVKKKKDNIVPIREIMPQVYRTIKSTQEINERIEMLCNIGFCELVGRKVRMLDEKAGS